MHVPQGHSENGMKAVFPKVPLEFSDNGDRSVKILKEADYIAHTQGNHAFPWRYFVISKQDKNIIANKMTYVLSSPCELKDCDWICPEQVSWDWWNHKMVWGMSFKAGVNNATYYIDFASKFSISYIIMDEGWVRSIKDPFTSIDEINIPNW